MFERRIRSALLVDFDNLIINYGRPLLDHIQNWVLWIEHGQFDHLHRRRKLVAKHVYWNSENDTHRQVFHKHRFDIHLCRAIRKEKASSADFDITIEAVRLLYKNPEIKEFIILSFDTDFSSVLLHLQLQGRSSVSMIDREKLDSVRDTATSKYMRVLDLSIEKEEFRAALNYAPSKKKLRQAPAAPVNIPIGVAPQPAPAPAQAQAAKPTQPKFDYAAAAQLIARTAEQNGLVYIGRERIRKLIGHLPGFMTPAGWPWAGGSYRRALNEFQRVHPEKFALEKMPNNGGVVLVYRGRHKNGGGAANTGNGAQEQQPPAA
ncbi:MAG: NYN domain-containing protein [Hyphomonadaceae bacterium]|nr:NYN domain-containing protein [Hyphomonadaceae bacterium]